MAQIAFDIHKNTDVRCRWHGCLLCCARHPTWTRYFTTFLHTMSRSNFSPLLRNVTFSIFPTIAFCKCTFSPNSLIIVSQCVFCFVVVLFYFFIYTFSLSFMCNSHKPLYLNTLFMFFFTEYAHMMILMDLGNHSTTIFNHIYEYI